MYNHEVRESIEEQKGKVSESEYRKMIEEHERNMEIFNRKLKSERERMLKVSQKIITLIINLYFTFITLTPFCFSSVQTLAALLPWAESYIKPSRYQPL